MIRCFLYLFVLVFWVDVLSVLPHERSEKLIQELDSEIPKWLTIGVPIKAGLGTLPPNGQSAFRPRSGGSTNSRNRVQIPNHGIEIDLDYEIDWTGNKEAGTGVSLSPDGKKLLVNSGPTSHLYEIQANGSYSEVPLQLPHVTYDAGLKGFLRGWSWADDDTLVAGAEITDEAGHEIIENRIYVFHMNGGVLSRLDLTALNIDDTDGIEVVGIGSDLNQLKLSVGSVSIIANADLKSPPNVQKSKVEAPEIETPVLAPTNKTPKPIEIKPATTSEEPASSVSIGIVAVLIAAALGIFWLLLTKERTRRRSRS